MKYNSIGEQLIAKAKELDPSYKPDKFNDMSEAINIILNNTGGGGNSDGGKLEGFTIDVSNTYNPETKEFSGTLTDEQWTKVQNEQIYWIEVVYISNQDASASALFNYSGPFFGEGRSFGDANGSIMIILDKSVQGMIIKGVLTIDTQSTPTSQLIPSITTTNTQQNLTIGDGLTIENGVLKTTSDGGQAMFDITQYVDDNMIMTEEGFNLLYNGLKSGKYAGIVFGYYNAYPICIDDAYPLRFQYINFEPSSTNDIYKMLIIDRHTLKISGLPGDEGNQDDFMYSAFYTKPFIEGGTSSIPCYNAETSEQQNLTIGDGLTIENGALKATGGGSGSSKVWYELPSLFFLENITQEQFDAIKNLVLQNQLAGINGAGIYCPLTFYNDGRDINFFYPWYENDIFTAYIVRLNADLSVKKIPYSTITLPQTAPTSQLIPSITTSNEQQNLTVGDGLKVENGVLKTNNIPELPSDASTKTYVLKSINGVLTWSE